MQSQENSQTLVEIKTRVAKMQVETSFRCSKFRYVAVLIYQFRPDSQVCPTF